VIDTWYRYPGKGSAEGRPSRHPFETLDNVVMTPHASGWSAGLLDRRWTFIARNLQRLERGEPLCNLLKRPGEAPSY
jgi:phosphoglycerate dehydrogenase-like enzyme